MTSKRDISPLSPAEPTPPVDSANPLDTAEPIHTTDLADLDETPSTGRHWLKYAGIGGHHLSSAEKNNPAKTKDEITSLGSLEAELLGILWEIGRPATGMEIMETTLYKRRARNEEPPAFATIATTLRRLATKGLLESRKNDTRTPLYWPTVEREQMAARILDNVSVTLLGTSLHGLLPKLIGNIRTRSEKAKTSEKSSATEPSQAEVADMQRLLQALEEVAKGKDTLDNKDTLDSNQSNTNNQDKTEA